MGKHKEKSKKKRDHKKSKKKHRKREYSSSSNSSSDEWVEKTPETQQENHEKNPETSHDEWMSLPTSFLSTSHLDRRRDREETKRQEREREKYKPSENVRELNPYWKDGGDGLPSVSKFKKPGEGSSSAEKYHANKPNRQPSWRKKESTTSISDENLQSSQQTESNLYTSEHAQNAADSSQSEKDLNALAAKLVKAEIMGNTKLVAELKEKLERARNNQTSNNSSDEHVLLTRTDSRGFSRPVKLEAESSERPGSSKNKKRKVETHSDGDRVRYFADDDKYNLKEMFENEKFNSVEDQNRQFMQLAGRIAKNDDLDDVFADKIRRKESDAKTEQRNKDKAIQEHRMASESLDNCRLCIQSSGMPKHLMVSMGEAFYLTLPTQEPLTEGHCVLVPVRHVPCGTQLDENEWADLMNFRKALVKMFAATQEDCIFFETAAHLNRFPHMHITCVPLPREQGDLAPIYFKKAIDESESEWASNKKLVSLKGKDVRRAVPKGLPYFCVSFGMEEGYAHVIEDYQLFPSNFAEEIVGGMLDLHHSKWRKPKRQSFEEQSKRVLEFSKRWKDFDFTVQ